MADPFRLTVLKRLTAVLEETLDPAAEFATVGKVQRGRLLTGEESDLPYITVVEAPRSGFNAYVGDKQATKTTWPLLIQGYCKDDLKEPTDALYRFGHEVSLRLAVITAEKADNSGRPAYPQYHLLGRDDDGHPMIADFEFGPLIVRPQDPAQSTKACFYLPVTITFAREVSA
ncbi:hypothetical protein D3C87_812700 [compost metagenome]